MSINLNNMSNIIPTQNASLSIIGANKVNEYADGRTVGKQAPADLPKANGTEDTADVQAKKRAGMIECETCRTRKYQDGSNDPGVSFKTAGHIDPSAARAVVMSHELEHVSNENTKAKAEGKEVVAQSVTLQTSVCPECGRVYVSGGETVTTTKGSDNQATSRNREPGKLLNVQV